MADQPTRAELIGGGQRPDSEDDSQRVWRCGCYEDQHGYHLCIRHMAEPPREAAPADPGQEYYEPPAGGRIVGVYRNGSWLEDTPAGQRKHVSWPDKPDLARAAFVAQVREGLLVEVGEQLAKAEKKHSSMRGAHEGYAVILEELDELWAEVKRQQIDHAQMRKEALHIAAMALRFVKDVCDPEITDPDLDSSCGE